MKSIFFLLLAILFSVGCNQGTNSSQAPVQAVDPVEESSQTPPDVVLTAFQEQFPSARKMEWKPAGDEWLVNFRDDEGKKKVTYHPAGTWESTEDKLEASNIPAEIMTHYETQYSQYRITGVRLFRSKSDSFYKIYVEQNEEELQLRYTLDGMFIKAKTM